ncbi:MAG TPA: DUF423 domain-containing protein [Candidatus Polarisedimenticolaceae bacterium]|nr:DUF423 domain-containing protein [Candidatus Polarisedimenticolaceae bacterium]
MTERWFALGGWLGALGVVLGAFGAHGLKSRVDAEMLAVWETASRYHLVHALALLATGWAASRWPGVWTSAAGWLFVSGIAIFSGSLYALALSGVRALGAITPIGGLCLIAGWVCLGMAAWRGSR